MTAVTTTTSATAATAATAFPRPTTARFPITTRRPFRPRPLPVS